jgi:predicted acylesterase/phospholipase RssA
MANENPLSFRPQEQPIAARDASGSPGTVRTDATAETVPGSRADHEVEREPRPVNGGNDAVCFTAGFSGATFGAGTIHAYLAADRDAPRIAAGISMGSLSAAALQRCYKELKPFPRDSVAQAPAKEVEEYRGRREAARWAWFRRYLTLLSERPFSVIWEGLPDQSDFYADMPPVRDTTVRKFPDENTREEWTEQERLSRRELYLFVKFGNWLATLPLRFSRIADYFVTYVRVKERNPEKWLQSWLKYRFWNWLALFFPVLWHICVSRQWFPERRFLRRRHLKEKYGPFFGRLLFILQYGFRYSRPLFGWRVLLVASLLLIGLIATPMELLLELLRLLARAQSDWLHNLYPQVAKVLPRPIGGLHLVLHQAIRWFLWVFSLGYHGGSAWFAGLFTLGVLTWFVSIFVRLAKEQGLKPFILRKLVQHLLRKLELEQALVHNFYLRYKLTQLFGKHGNSPSLDSDPMPILLVAAPLQVLKHSGRPIYGAQVWARATPDIPFSLVDALATTLAAPGLYRPLHLQSQREIKRWVRHDPPRELHLVDGNVVRQNPIPSLFTYLKEENKKLADELSSDPGNPRVHVVYNVPTRSSSDRAPSSPSGLNIVDVIRLSLQLNKRRDTNLEVEQTNFISRLEYELRGLNHGPSGRAYPIFADQIAPEDEIAFENALNPRPDEVLTHVANGCRRTLETLYQRHLKDFPCASAAVPCSTFIAHIAPARFGSADPRATPGVPEVCARCSGQLARSRARDPFPPVNGLSERFPMLTGLEPRIIFVASGGVFRGPFHAGMLACLFATQIRPDMIIGASVGTLMGGALGSLFSLRARDGQPGYDRAIALLGELLEVFLHVDRDVAFTKTLKNAAREIGLRGRAFRLSPNKIRKLIRRGSRHDAGFASTGAPSALIDALSDFLLIPHETTARIAAKFVAGRLGESTRLLIDALKGSTLRRLDIESAVFGVSLIEPAARRLLGEQYGICLDLPQPFIEALSNPPPGGPAIRGIAFFGTTTNLLNERPVLFGRHTVPGAGRYDFVQAALASSAFPGVFSPRRESEVFPGAGRSDVFFSDGGMFDNLPFIPALRLLGDVQRDCRRTKSRECIEYLGKRHERPDLFIAGSLNVRPEQTENADGPFDDLVSIKSRADSLVDNVKIRAFEGASKMVGDQLSHFIRYAPLGYRTGDPDFEQFAAFVDGIVDPTVLPVFPCDRAHLNPTFAFCKSTGFRADRVQRSIADGCFQTFAAFADAQDKYPPDDPPQAARSLDPLRNLGRVPSISWVAKSKKPVQGKSSCPWFRHNVDERLSQEKRHLEKTGEEHDFTCPFAAILNDKGRPIFQACCSDGAHFRQAQEHREKASKIRRFASSVSFSVKSSR